MESKWENISQILVWNAFCFDHIFYLFIYLFLAVSGICCCVRAFSSCGEWGLLFVTLRWLLIMVASLVVEHRLQARGLNSCGARA